MCCKSLWLNDTLCYVIKESHIEPVICKINSTRRISQNGHALDITITWSVPDLFYHHLKIFHCQTRFFWSLPPDSGYYHEQELWLCRQWRLLRQLIGCRKQVVRVLMYWLSHDIVYRPILTLAIVVISYDETQIAKQQEDFKRSVSTESHLDSIRFCYF